MHHPHNRFVAMVALVCEAMYALPRRNRNNASCHGEFWLLCVARFLLGVNVPDDVVGQAKDAVAGPLGHLRKAFGVGLVLEGVSGEVDA